MRDRSDVVIVGGGPAGLALAKFLAEAGVGCTLLEEDRSFYEKPCGEGITPSLAGYNFDDLYGSRAGIEKITERHLIRMERGNLEFTLPNIITDKRAVEEELARQAAGRGAVIRMGERVREITREGDTLVVRPQEIGARVVVGADGFSSVVRQFMGIGPPRHFGVAATGYWTGEPPGDACITEFRKSVAPGGYAWWFPRKADWNIGIGTAKPRLFDQQLQHFRARYPEVKDWHVGVMPLAMPLRSYGRDTLLVGDSASQVIAVLADGILPAMICAEIAAGVLARASRNDFRDLDLSLYEKGWKEVLGASFRDGYLAHRIMMSLYFSDSLLYRYVQLLGRMLG